MQDLPTRRVFVVPCWDGLVSGADAGCGRGLEIPFEIRVAVYLSMVRLGEKEQGLLILWSFGGEDDER